MTPACSDRLARGCRSSWILGEAQWTWLEKQLQAPAQIRIIVSSIALVAEDCGYEKWMNFPHERQRLFDLLKKSQSTGVLVISGDQPKYAAAGGYQNSSADRQLS